MQSSERARLRADEEAEAEAASASEREADDGRGPPSVRADTLRAPRASWRSSAASRSSHWAPTSAIQASASDIGAGVGR